MSSFESSLTSGFERTRRSLVDTTPNPLTGMAPEPASDADGDATGDGDGDGVSDGDASGVEVGGDGRAGGGVAGAGREDHSEGHDQAQVAMSHVVSLLENQVEHVGAAVLPFDADDPRPVASAERWQDTALTRRAATPR